MITIDLMLYSLSLGYFASILQHKQKLEKQEGEGGATDHKLLHFSQIEAFSPCYMHTGHNCKDAKVLQLDV